MDRGRRVKKGTNTPADVRKQRPPIQFSADDAKTIQQVYVEHKDDSRAAAEAAERITAQRGGEEAASQLWEDRDAKAREQCVWYWRMKGNGKGLVDTALAEVGTQPANRKRKRRTWAEIHAGEEGEQEESE